MSIISFEDLNTRKTCTEIDLDMLKDFSKQKLPKGITYKLLFAEALRLRLEELESHMKLQERNEKLRRKNSRLIEIISSIRSALRG